LPSARYNRSQLRPASRIEYCIHACGALAEIIGSIISGYAAECSLQVTLGLGCGAERFQANERAELQRGRSSVLWAEGPSFQRT
jgi:hypothetical protein